MAKRQTCSLSALILELIRRGWSKTKTSGLWTILGIAHRLQHLLRSIKLYQVRAHWFQHKTRNIYRHFRITPGRSKLSDISTFVMLYGLSVILAAESVFASKYLSYFIGVIKSMPRASEIFRILSRARHWRSHIKRNVASEIILNPMTWASQFHEASVGARAWGACGTTSDIKALNAFLSASADRRGSDIYSPATERYRRTFKSSSGWRWHRLVAVMAISLGRARFRRKSLRSINAESIVDALSADTNVYYFASASQSLPYISCDKNILMLHQYRVFAGRPRA